MDKVKSGFMRWKTACRWSKDSRDGGLNLSVPGFTADNAKNITLLLETPKYFEVFEVIFPAVFPSAPCTARSVQKGLQRYITALNDAFRNPANQGADVIKTLDLIATVFKSHQEQDALVADDPQEDENDNDDNNQTEEEFFVYDEDAPDTSAFLRQTSVVFTASQRGTLSAEAARIITKEFNAVKRAKAQGTLPFHILPETEEDIGKWAIELKILSDCSLGKQMAARSVPGILIQICFHNNHPQHPPLVRIVGPRLKYLSGNVTFSGVVCLDQLTTQGWRPIFTVQQICEWVAASLIENNARLDIRTRTGYQEEEALATRLTREKSLSEYQRPYRHLQARRLFAFRAENTNTGNRVNLPGSLFESLVRDNNMSVDVMVFLVETPSARTFVGTQGFGAMEGIIEMPLYMMENMLITDGTPVNVRLVKLPILSFVKFKPLEFELVSVLEESRKEGTFGTEACPLVQAIGQNFVPFTMGDTIQVIVQGKPYHLFVLKTEPSVVAILPQDGQMHELKIDFSTAVDMVEVPNMGLEQDVMSPPPLPQEAPTAPPVPTPSPAAPAVDTQMCPLCGKYIAVMSLVLHQNRCRGQGADIEIARRLQAEQEAEEERQNKERATKEAQERMQEAFRAEVRRKEREQQAQEKRERCEREKLKRELASTAARSTAQCPTAASTRPAAARLDVPPCKYWWGQGSCRDGAACMFGHGSDNPTRGSSGERGRAEELPRERPTTSERPLDPEKVRLLIDMGFPRDKVIKALRENGENIEATANALMGQ